MNNQDGSPALSGTHGFTLFEVVVALAVTMIMIGSVFGLMAGGQTTFRRETQVADMQMSTRAGLQLLSHDLAMAGYRTPPASAIIWADSGGLQPDEITIVYADPDVPLSRPIECGGAGGPCGTSASPRLYSSIPRPRTSLWRPPRTPMRKAWCLRLSS
jgi:Tfp pilus assembly protein PilW